MARRLRLWSLVTRRQVRVGARAARAARASGVGIRRLRRRMRNQLEVGVEKGNVRAHLVVMPMQGRRSAADIARWISHQVHSTKTRRNAKSVGTLRAAGKRQVGAQAEEDWWTHLETEDPKEACAVLKKFEKHERSESKAAKFSIAEHKRRIKHRKGNTKVKHREWMWEKEYCEEMSKTKHGNLTEGEAKAKWRELEKACKPQHKDYKGPRGMLRMKIHVADYEDSFSGIESEEELEISAGSKKKQTAEQIEQAAQQLLRNTATRRSSMFTGNESDRSDTGDDSDGALRKAADLAAAGASVRAYGKQPKLKTPVKKKRGDDDGSIIDGDEESDAETRSEVTAPSGKKKKRSDGDQEPPTPDQWFDLETLLPKAARALLKNIQSVKTDLELVDESCAAALLEFESRGVMNDAAIAKEFRTLQNRQEAVKLVLGASNTSESQQTELLAKYVAKFGTSSAVSDGGSTHTGNAGAASAGPASTTRVGPCSTYKDLVSIRFLLSKAEQLKAAEMTWVLEITSATELTAATDALERHFKAMRDLKKAAAASVTDLFQAKLDADSLKESTDQARKKAAKDREKVLTEGPKVNKKGAVGSEAAAPSLFAGKLFSFQAVRADKFKIR